MGVFRCCRWLAGLALAPLPACTTAFEFTSHPAAHSRQALATTAHAAPAPARPRPPASHLPISPAEFEPSSPDPEPSPPPIRSAALTIELRPIEPAEAVAPSSDVPTSLAESSTPAPVASATTTPPAPPLCEWLVKLYPLALRLADGSLAQADPEDLAAFVEQLNMALLPLRARAALDIPKLCFCRPVAAAARFGTYERLDENHRFRPGETVAVYMELRNFVCVARDGDFVTHVIASIELHDSNGQVVLRFDSDRSDPSLSPRQDYCHVGRFTLPALPPGAYTLWLKATDVPTGRSVRRSLDFRVGSGKRS